jgi:hypothetical protein
MEYVEHAWQTAVVTPLVSVGAWMDTVVPTSLRVDHIYNSAYSKFVDDGDAQSGIFLALSVMFLLWQVYKGIRRANKRKPRYRGGRNADGKMHGKTGQLRGANGDRYDGAFVDGRFEGKGTYVFAGDTGAKYVGDWVGGLYEGAGVETYAGGVVYKGAFAGGKRHGYGVMTYANGSVYKGAWVDGRKQGKGIMELADGKGMYEGRFHAGKRHGQGYHKIKGEPKVAQAYVHGVLQTEASAAAAKTTE